MKKNIVITALFLCMVSGLYAQKYVTVDMEYILKNIPAYERANEQLNQQSKRWQGEIEDLVLEAEMLYKQYQSESAFLSDKQRAEREEAILAAEKAVSELKRTYFGPQGELYKKRESLMAPIQEEILLIAVTASRQRPTNQTADPNLPFRLYTKHRTRRLRA